MAPAPVVRGKAPAAKPTKVRYFKGKAPEAAVSSGSEDESEEEVAPEPVKVDKTLVAGGAGRIIPQGTGGVIRRSNEQPTMKLELRDVKIEGGRVVLPKSTTAQDEESEEESEEEDEVEVKPAPGIPKPASSEDSSEYETDSEEESEEDKKPAFRPVFVRKDARGMTQEKAAAEAEAKAKAEEEAQEQRKVDSKDLAGETIRRELLEREAKDIQPDVDDTDGLDPAAEFDAWRARELARLLRDKQAQAEKDLEREEIERRRAMPEDQRLQEDLEYAQQTRDKEKGQMGFLQKYYHKGAFHQEDELLQRDYTGATESAVDMSMLPKVMQVRNFGKMSRTKYTHLVDQDTSQGGWGTAARPAAQGEGGTGQFAQGCWNCGGPHLRKDCPNDDPDDPLALLNRSNGGSSGNANTSALGGGGGRSWGAPQDYGNDRGNKYRDEGRERRFEEVRQDERDQGRSRDSGYKRSREDDRHGREPDDRKRYRSRSRSPGRRRDDRDRRDDQDKRDDRRRDDRDRR